MVTLRTLSNIMSRYVVNFVRRQRIVASYCVRAHNELDGMRQAREIYMTETNLGSPDTHDFTKADQTEINIHRL